MTIYQLRNLDMWVKKVGGDAEKVTRAVALQMTNEVINRTRVDTGRARGNWHAEINTAEEKVFEFAGGGAAACGVDRGAQSPAAHFCQISRGTWSGSGVPGQQGAGCQALQSPGAGFAGSGAATASQDQCHVAIQAPSFDCIGSQPQGLYQKPFTGHGARGLDRKRGGCHQCSVVAFEAEKLANEANA